MPRRTRTEFGNLRKKKKYSPLRVAPTSLPLNGKGGGTDRWRKEGRPRYKIGATPSSSSFSPPLPFKEKIRLDSSSSPFALGEGGKEMGSVALNQRKRGGKKIVELKKIINARTHTHYKFPQHFCFKDFVYFFTHKKISLKIRGSFYSKSSWIVSNPIPLWRPPVSLNGPSVCVCLEGWIWKGSSQRGIFSLLSPASQINTPKIILLKRKALSPLGQTLFTQIPGRKKRKK